MPAKPIVFPVWEGKESPIVVNLLKLSGNLRHTILHDNNDRSPFVDSFQPADERFNG